MQQHFLRFNGTVAMALGTLLVMVMVLPLSNYYNRAGHPRSAGDLTLVSTTYSQKTEVLESRIPTAAVGSPKTPLQTVSIRVGVRGVAIQNADPETATLLLENCFLLILPEVQQV